MGIFKFKCKIPPPKKIYFTTLLSYDLNHLIKIHPLILLINYSCAHSNKSHLFHFHFFFVFLVNLCPLIIRRPEIRLSAFT